jgi:hypothetical protein
MKIKYQRIIFNVLLMAIVAIMLSVAPAIAGGGPTCNVSAQIAPASQTVPELTSGAPTQVKLNGEPSKDESTYSWIQTGGPNVTLSDSTAAQPTFAAPSVGAAGAALTFQLTVTGCSPVQRSTTTTTINVTNVETNLPPVVSATVSPYPYALEGELVTLDGSMSSDPDGDTLTYGWLQINGTTVPLSLADPSGKIATFIAPNDAYPYGEALTFKLTVSDGNLTNSVDKIVNITWVNDPPMAVVICPETVNEGDPVTLDGSGSTDSDDGIASYAWNQLTGLPNADLTGANLSDSSIFFTAPELTSPLNTMTFELTVTDHGNLQDAETCQIAVLDVTPPVIGGATDITAEATSASGAAVNFDLIAHDLVDGDVAVTCSPVSGSTFALGVTTVECTASDSAGNSALASFTVTVQDTTPPNITGMPSDITAEATGPSGAVVNYTSPTASDLVDGSVTVSCVPASASIFVLGATVVNCSASDSHGNTATAGFNITVVDTTPPALTLPAPITAEATGPAGATVTFSASASDLVDGTVAVICVPASGSTFALGSSTVSCSASDNSDNTASASFTVTVQDTTPPVIAAHEDVTAEATSAAGAVVDYTSPSTSDAVDGAGTATCSPASGNIFPLGATTVTCNAKDAAGNQAKVTTFSIIVQDTTPPALTLPGEITAVATEDSQEVVNYIASANDIVDGPVDVTCSPASGSIFSVGTTTVNCSATDSHGNTGMGNFRVIVVYNWDGFFQPVDNQPVINVAKAGSSIPVKFSLNGNQGLNIMSTGYPASGVIACDSSAVTDVVSDTSTAGSSSLTYDATEDQYIYVWKTEKAWATKCRQLQVKLKDGTVHMANFKFK